MLFFPMQELCVKRKLFGKEVEIAVMDTEETTASEIIEETYEEGLRLQKIFNFYDEQSTLFQLNQKRRLVVPQEFLDVLEKALSMCRKTHGRYDISLGKQFIQRKKGIPVLPLSCSYKDIQVKGNTVELSHTDAMIDFGSIAKGYIADKMAGYLIKQGPISGLIDARGDIRVFGNKEHIIEIQHPRIKEQSLCAIKLKNGGIATSGDYNQYHHQFDKSHILNQQDYISVTVIAPTLIEADLYATAIFVSPREKVGHLLENHTKVRALCVDKDLNLEYYHQFEEAIHEQ